MCRISIKLCLHLKNSTKTKRDLAGIQWHEGQQKRHLDFVPRKRNMSSDMCRSFKYIIAISRVPDFNTETGQGENLPKKKVAAFQHHWNPPPDTTWLTSTTSSSTMEHLPLALITYISPKKFHGWIFPSISMEKQGLPKTGHMTFLFETNDRKFHIHFYIHTVDGLNLG